MTVKMCHENIVFNVLCNERFLKDVDGNNLIEPILKLSGVCHGVLMSPAK